jgi:release factor glutamine methyltransferase
VSAAARELLRDAARELERATPSPMLDARVLLAHVLACSPEALLAHDDRAPDAAQARQFKQLVEKRRAHWPVAYLVGEKEFFGISFRVSPGVLIPRPESELLVERGAELCALRSEPRILDLATGSGCVAISLASALAARKQPFQLTASDVSREALAVAEENIRRAESSGIIPKGSVALAHSDWLSALSGKFSLITCNPPYVAEESRAALAKDLDFEPASALFAGKDGLDAYRALMPAIAPFIERGGTFLSEMGAEQRGALNKLASGILGKEVRVAFLKDLAGLDRAVEITFPT